MNKEELSLEILGTDVDVPKFYSSFESKILDKCLEIINGLEEEIKHLKEGSEEVIPGIHLNRNLQGCKVVVIGAGDKTTLLEAIQRAELVPHAHVIGVAGSIPKFPEMPERPPVELLLQRLPDIRDAFYDEPKRKGHERPFKYHK